MKESNTFQFRGFGNFSQCEQRQLSSRCLIDDEIISWTLLGRRWFNANGLYWKDWAFAASCLQKFGNCFRIVAAGGWIRV